MIRSVTVLALSITIAGDPQHSYKTQTELVRLDVLVEQNGQPVSNLTASNFVVEADGVPQRISLLQATEPATVATLLDVSGSMTAQQLTNAGAGIHALRSALKDLDRYSVYAFANDIQQLDVDIGNATSAAIIARALSKARGVHTSLYDGLFSAIIQSDVAPGPKLAMVLTDGRDNTSWLSAQSVIDTAIRHETVIYAVAVGPEVRRNPFDAPPMEVDDGLRLLQLLAERTGGRLLHTDWKRDLGPIFETVLGEFRQRFILSFTPEGVRTADGWHKLEVRLRNSRGRVHSRQGYWSR